jgi:N6-adenosine-specific RNA methylase IME4
VNHAPCRILCADPPWSFGDKLPGASRGAAKNYDVLALHDIMRFPLPAFEENAILFLWRVASQVEEAYQVVRAWGFVPKTEMTWVKTTGPVPNELSLGDAKLHFGMGRYTRASHETCIVAVRGKFADQIVDKGIRSVFFAPAGEHSEKPAIFYTLVERLVGGKGPFVELFGRKPRAGWHVYGNEIPDGYVWTPPGARVADIALCEWCSLPKTKCKTLGLPGCVSKMVTMLRDLRMEPDISEEPSTIEPPVVASETLEDLEALASSGGPIPPELDNRPYDAFPRMMTNVEGTDEFVDAYCGTCHQPQYWSPGGGTCVHGHGGARGIPYNLINRYLAWCKTCETLHHESVGCMKVKNGALVPAPPPPEEEPGPAVSGCVACDRGEPFTQGKEYLHTNEGIRCRPPNQPIPWQEEQRRSFATGNVGMGNPKVTREVVDAAAEELMTSKIVSVGPENVGDLTPKRRGRPKGSKNKPKAPPEPQAVPVVDTNGWTKAFARATWIAAEEKADEELKKEQVPTRDTSARTIADRGYMEPTP